MKTYFLVLSNVFLASLRGVNSHAFLTKPTSKQGGDETAPRQSPATQFALSAFWLDRSYFDNDPKKTPFSRPGEFSYKDANTCCGVKQVFHPCGCQSSDISTCAGVGQARGFGELIGHDSIVPEKIAIGGKLKTKFFMHVNHGGGYAYSLCPKSEYDRCFNKHTPKTGDAPDSPKTLAYLKCVWDCFESNPLSFTGDQLLQLRGSESDHVKLNAVSKTGRSGRLTTTFREVPIEDTNDRSGSGWKYAQSFSNDVVKDQFTADFAPGAFPGTSQPRNWQVVDEVQIPSSGLAPGQYLLSWRYDCGKADQLWSNCADVELVVGAPPKNTKAPPQTTKTPPQTSPTVAIATSPPTAKTPKAPSTTIPTTSPTTAKTPKAPSTTTATTSSATTKTSKTLTTTTRKSAAKKRIVAYVPNWTSCPSADQLKHYTHAMVAFAVTYPAYNPRGDNCASDTSCTVQTVPGCGGKTLKQMTADLQAVGLKVILSFGGAGMGGTWRSSVDRCWDHCLGKAESLVGQLEKVVTDAGVDGLDIDYEYFLNQAPQRAFLEQLVVGLHARLHGKGVVLTHAPMDVDLCDTSFDRHCRPHYRDILQKHSDKIDFILPQFYNGVTQPTRNFAKVNTLFTSLKTEIFCGDGSKVVLGLCNGDCSGTGSNADGEQALGIMKQLQSAHSDMGGMMFWDSTKDNNGAWSKRVYDYFRCELGTLFGQDTLQPGGGCAPTILSVQRRNIRRSLRGGA